MAKGKQQKAPAVSIKKTGAKVSAKTISARYKSLFKDTRNQYEQIDAYFQSLKWKTRVIDRPQNAQERILKEKYLKEREVETRAAQLLNFYSSVNLSRGEAIQAVKTDKISELTNKWNPRLVEFKRVQDAMRRGRMGELLRDEQ